MLPPGPRLPMPLQTLGWIARPGPFLERCRDRYGDAFTLRIANEGTWVMLSDPAAVKQVFTGDPELLHAGEANAILRPILGPSSVLLLDDGAHLAQRKLLLPPFHGARMKAYGALMEAGRGGRDRHVARGAGRRLADGDAADHARDRHPGGVRGRRRGRARAAAGRAGDACSAGSRSPRRWRCSPCSARGTSTGCPSTGG